MGRKLDIEWQHSEDEFYELYKSAEDLDARRRYQALWLLRRGKDVNETANETGVSYRTVQRWKNWYNEGGLQKLLENTHGGKREVPKRLSWEDRDQLVAEISKGKFQNFEEIKDWIKERFGVEYTESGIRSMYYRLKMHLAEHPLRKAARDIGLDDAFERIRTRAQQRREQRRKNKKTIFGDKGPVGKSDT